MVTKAGRILSRELAPHVGKAPEEIAHACSLLTRHATTLHAGYERECSVDMTDRERARHEKREAMIEARVRVIAGEIGAVSVRFNGDPRGVPIKLTLPTGRGNGMGGDSDGWAVAPTRFY